MSKTLPTIDNLLKDGLLMKGSDERLLIRRLATGIPSLDEILGGGFPYARTTLMVGPESTGKTLIAQYVAKAQQQIVNRSHVLLVDTERSYDERWWKASNVNTEELIISQPTTGEKAIDIMRCMLESDKELGLIILDSVACMTPMPILDKDRSAEDKNMGLLAQLVNLMFYTLMPLNKQAIFLITNHVRSSIGGYDEVYPGGKGLRQYSHIILRTRREGWLTEGNQRIGFNLEVYCKKNKTGLPEGTTSIPFRFRGQLDLMQSYIDEAVNRGLIRAAPPYYYLGEKKFMGKAALRQYLADDEAAYSQLQEELKTLGIDKNQTPPPSGAISG